MVLEDARQAAAAADRMLKAVHAGGVATAELRAALEQTRVFMATGAAFQTAAAELIARRERHGDGGAEILASSAGLSQREAHAQVATAAALQKVPRLRDAVQSGDVPQANARRLADAITKTGSAAVAGDARLLAQAQSMRPEQFAKTAQRWIGSQQADDGTAEYLRQRARRYLKIYDTDDGMVCLHGEFDKITGTRIRNRLRHTAGRLLDADKKQPQTQRRKFPQCMADALQHHTTRTSAGDAQNAKAATSITRSSGDARTRSPRTGDAARGATRDTDTTSSRHASGGTDTGCGDTKAGPGSAETCHGDHGHRRGPRGQSTAGLTGSGNTDSDRDSSGRVQQSRSTDTGGSVSAITGSGGCDASACRSDAVAAVCQCVDADSTSPAAGTYTDAAADAVSAGESGGGNAGAGWVADITVLAHVDDSTGELIGELSDGSKLPAAVLDELSCNARWAGLVFDRAGDAIWRSRSRRTVSDTQWQALLATYGGCFHCAAPAGMCQAHHITPYSQGGATSLDNLIMVCWNCHHKIHHHNWRIEKHSDGSHTLHPPDNPAAATQPRYGPAHADGPPPGPEPPRPSTRTRTRKTRARTETSSREGRTRARDPALW